MPAIVRFPEVVEQALVTLDPLFKNQQQRQHLGEYLTGLYVAKRKSVNGINAEFVDTTDQSCLNRWLNESPWDVSVLNEARLAHLQKHHDTRYSKYGVITIDDTLIDHDGKLIEDARHHVGVLEDHPRSCGEHQLGRRPGRLHRGITPAHAGNTFSLFPTIYLVHGQ